MASTRPVPARGLGRLALRRPRPAGPRHRRGVERGERGAARPAPAPRSRRCRAHQRRPRPRAASASGCSSPRRSCRSAGSRASCHTSSSSSWSRSLSPAPTGCPSRCSSARASGSRSRARASRPSSAAPSSRRARRPLLLVDRRPLLLARPAARRHLFDTSNAIVSGIGVVALAAAGDRRAAPDRPHRPLARHEHRLDRPRRRNGDDRRRRGDRLQRPLPRRLDPRRRRLRRRLPRRPARARRGHPGRAPRHGHVRVLRRRLRLALGARRRSQASSSPTSRSQSTFEIFGSVVAAIALLVAFEAWADEAAAHGAASRGAPQPAGVLSRRVSIQHRPKEA